MADESAANVAYEQRNAKRMVRIERLKDAVSSITNERDAIKAERDRLMTENAELRTKADDSATVKRVQELEGQLREVEHRKAFDRTARAKGVADDAIDLLYQASGYKAEGDEPDETAIGALIDEQKGKPGIARLFADAPATPETPVKPGKGTGKGGATGANGTDYTFAEGDERLNDVRFQMMNFGKIQAAAQARMDRGEI